MSLDSHDPCACESGLAFSECCEPVLAEPSAAQTPEALMRSRYSAFVLHDRAHLLATWHPETRPRSITLDPDQRWLGLKIKQASGTHVEFVARYKVHGRGHRIHETSRFEHLDGRWFYVDGDVQDR
jgi:SEC-C motif-containing protein